MGIRDKITNYLLRRTTRGTCKTMFITFFVVLGYYKDKNIYKTNTELIAETLRMRRTWNISKNPLGGYYASHNTGKIVEIREAESAANVTLSVILIESENAIFDNTNPEAALNVIVNEYKKFYRSRSNEIDKIIENNSDYKRLKSILCSEFISQLKKIL